MVTSNMIRTDQNGIFTVFISFCDHSFLCATVPKYRKLYRVLSSNNIMLFNVKFDVPVLLCNFVSTKLIVNNN